MQCNAERSIYLDHDEAPHGGLLVALHGRPDDHVAGLEQVVSPHLVLVVSLCHCRLILKRVGSRYQVLRVPILLRLVIPDSKTAFVCLVAQVFPVVVSFESYNEELNGK